MLTRTYRDDVPQGSESVTLGRYMNGIYAMMAVGLAVSAASATLVANDARLNALLFARDGATLIGWIVLLAPLGLVVTIGAGAQTMTRPAARALFVTYAVLMGLSLGSIGYSFTGASIAGTLVATGASFALLCLWGFTTRRDLSPLGAFFGIALFGIVISMAFNLWMRSARLDLALSAAAIVTFAALTAFDVQRLRRLYLEGDTRSSTVGALTLYLDFLNMFLSLLRFTGRRR